MANRHDRLRAARLISNRGEKKRSLRAQTVEKIIAGRKEPVDPIDPKFLHSAARWGST